MRNTFIVICHPRCGSTYFCNKIMPSSPDVWCYDALFRQDRPPTIKHLHRLGLSYYDDVDIELYLENHYDKAAGYSGKNIIGFKIFNGHLIEDDLNIILDNTNYKKILLHRKSILKSAVSYQIAKNTGQWDHRDKMDFEPFKIDIDKCIDWINTNKLFIRNTRNYLASNNIKFHEIEYNEIFDIHCINGVFNYLGAHGISAIPRWGVPLNSTNRYKLIKNIDEVEKILGSNDNGFLFD